MAAAKVSNAVYGCALEGEERKMQIARTLRGSLYYTALWGNDEEGCVLALCCFEYVLTSAWHIHT
jgi:hypothetical protein